MKSLQLKLLKSSTFSLLFSFCFIATFISCSDEPLIEDETESLLIKDRQLEAKLKKATTWQEQIEILDQKMRRFHNFQVAVAQGYVPAGPYVPQMGYHFINPALVGDGFNLLEPEILVYYPDEEGNMIFGAAEYFAPIPDIRVEEDENGDPICVTDGVVPAPEGFIGDADVWEENCGPGGWTLHAWVGTENPHGVFVDHNPLVPATDVSQD